GVSSAATVSSIVSAISGPLDAFYLFDAREHQLEDLVDCNAQVRVRDDGHAVPSRTLDDVLLDPPDVVETVEVLLMWSKSLGAGVADHEVGAVLLLVVDREHALDDESTLDGRQHPRDQVDALEDGRPTFLERPVDRGSDADEDVPRLLQESRDDRILG